MSLKDCSKILVVGTNAEAENLRVENPNKSITNCAHTELSGKPGKFPSFSLNEF